MVRTAIAFCGMDWELGILSYICWYILYFIFSFVHSVQTINGLCPTLQQIPAVFEATVLSLGKRLNVGFGKTSSIFKDFKIYSPQN